MSKGTKNDTGKAPIHFLSREFLEGTAQAQAFGAKKYGDFNFTKGINYTRLLDAAMRHITAFTWGEDTDPESFESHISHAAANLNMLMFMIKHKPEMDDRYNPEKEKADAYLKMRDQINENISKELAKEIRKVDNGY